MSNFIYITLNDNPVIINKNIFKVGIINEKYDEFNIILEYTDGSHHKILYQSKKKANADFNRLFIELNRTDEIKEI